MKSGNIFSTPRKLTKSGDIFPTSRQCRKSGTYISQNPKNTENQG